MSSLSASAKNLRLLAINTLSTSPDSYSKVSNELPKITNFCKKLCEKLPNYSSIAIVSTNAQQRNEMRDAFGNGADGIDFCTYESIHGMEKDIVILKISRSDLNYLDKYNLLSTVITRAKKALFVCASLSVCAFNVNNGAIGNLIDYAKSRDCYHEINDKDEQLNLIMKNTRT